MQSLTRQLAESAKQLDQAAADSAALKAELAAAQVSKPAVVQLSQVRIKAPIWKDWKGAQSICQLTDAAKQLDQVAAHSTASSSKLAAAQASKPAVVQLSQVHTARSFPI